MSICDRIQTALQLLNPQHVETPNESHVYSRGLRTHFKVVPVSPQFAGLSAVKRHQEVYTTLGGLMGKSHTPALHTFTPEEWSRAAMPSSSTCRGGSKHDTP